MRAGSIAERDRCGLVVTYDNDDGVGNIDSARDRIARGLSM